MESFRILIDVRENIQREGIYMMDASTAGLPPGEWPDSLETGIDTIQTFYRVGAVLANPEIPEFANSEVILMIYANKGGDLLRVFND